MLDFILDNLFVLIITLVVTIILITLIIPITKLSGGDLKLAMGYGAFLTVRNYIVFFFFYSLFVLLGSIFLLIKKEGFKSFFSDLKLEIKTFGRHKTGCREILGAPFLLGAYLATLICSYNFL